MIQHIKKDIKDLIKKESINYQSPATGEEFQMIENLLINSLYYLNSHSHKEKNGCKTICKSTIIGYKFSYERNYITIVDHKTVEHKVNIPVVYCKNCEHHHAILPCQIIIPYVHYSLFFILQVLYDKQSQRYTVEELTSLYSISTSTLYRWIKSYSAYLKIYIQIRNKYHMQIFVALFSSHEAICNELYEITGYSFLEYNCKLITPT